MGVNVLSQFDGISCGQLALQRAGIQVDNYFASEIDKYAIKITQKNFPNTIQLGDVRNWKSWDLPKIDILIAGSPCQGFSLAGKGLNFDDPRSKLFFDFVDTLHCLQDKKPNLIFLLENVKMKKEWQDIISEQVGVKPIKINSALVSSQNRERLYWTNIPNITQPKDRKIFLDSVLLSKVSSNLFLSPDGRNYMDREVSDGRTHWDFGHHSDTENDKSSAIVANFSKGIPYNVLIDRRKNKCPFWSCDFWDEDDSFCSECRDDELSSYQGENYSTSAIRKFHPIECERLQTLPDNYTEGISNTQRYKCIGNGWTVDVVAHIFSFAFNAFSQG